MSEADRQLVLDYLQQKKLSSKAMCQSLICLAQASVANLCIIPMQDYLGYDNKTRMNTPSTLGQNWKWRLKEGEITEELLAEIHRITRIYGRCEKAKPLTDEACDIDSESCGTDA